MSRHGISVLRIGYEWNGAKYWYITNLQGDILYVVNSAGTPIGSYTYSPYGDFTATVLSSSDSTAFSANHLTYRGYYYDTETGLYYLNARYYDPQTGRFINADSQLNEGILGYNLFAYCENNPIKQCDPNGTYKWDTLSKFGEACLKSAIVVAGVCAAAIIIGSAISGTIISGGAGAIAIPAVVSTALKCVAVVTTATATLGVASVAAAKIGENGTSTPSTTTWRSKQGKERLDVENPNPGNRNGQIHYHEPNNQKHMFDLESGKFANATKRLNTLLSNPQFVKGLNKALRILGIR